MENPTPSRAPSVTWLEQAKVKIESVTSTRKRVSIEVPKEILSSELKVTYGAYRSRIRMNGYRPGKAPEAMVRKLAKEDVEGDVARRLIQKTLFPILEKNEIVPIETPAIEDLSLDEEKGFSFSAAVDVSPEIVLRKYHGLEITGRPVVVSQSEIDEQVNAYRSNLAVVREITDERGLMRGDVALIDFEGSIDGELFEGGEAVAFSVEIGSKELVGDFEDQLMGMKKGEERTIHVTFPADYADPKLRGKRAEFWVKLDQIQKKELPPVDDRLAESALGLKTVAEMRSQIEKELREIKEREEKSRATEQLLDRLIAENPVEPPISLVDRLTEQRLEEVQNRLRQYRLSQGESADPTAQIRAMYRMRATRDLQIAYLLDAIAKKEQLKVTESDVDREIEQIRSENSGRALHFSSKERESLENHLLEQKALEFLREKAKIKKE